MKFLKAKINWN